MFLPIGDEPNPRGTAWMTWLLIATNVAIYLLVNLPLSGVRPDPSDPALLEYARFLIQATGSVAEASRAIASVTRYDLFVFAHGFRPSHPGLADLFFSMFLHAGFLHLAGNMLFLWIYGDNVEARLGRFRYLLVYLATGAAATGAHALFAHGSPVPTLGASGAISGVLGCYFIWFPQNRVKVFVVLFPFFMDVVRVPARFVLGVYLLLDNLLPFLFSSSAGGGVAYGAHLGGFVAGLGVTMLSGRRGDAGARKPGLPDLSGHDPSDLPDEIHARLAAGDAALAAKLYLEIWPSDDLRRQVAPADALRIARHYESTGAPEVALAIYQRYLADHPSGPLLDRAHLGAGIVLLGGLGQPVAAREHLLAAIDFATDGDVLRSAKEALGVADSVNRR